MSRERPTNRRLVLVGLACAVASALACDRSPAADVSGQPSAASVGPAPPVDPNPQTSVTSRWEEFEAAGPLAVVPSRRAFREHAWGTEPLHLFAALYPADAFRNVEDFSLFTRYTSSIQQFLVRDGEVDLEWFYPEARDEAVPKFLHHLKMTPRLSGAETAEVVRGWGLPEEFAWIGELTFGDTLLDYGDDGLELTAETAEGYLCMFALLD